VVADSDDADDDDDDDKSGENAPEKGPVTPTEEPAAKTDESNDDEGESTSSSQKAINDTDGSGCKDADSSEPTSSSRKTDDVASSNNNNNDSSGPASSPRKTDDSSEPMSSSCKTDNGTDSSSDETTESAESSEKVANDSKSTSDATQDATSSVSAGSADEQSSEEASKKAAKIDTRLKERQPRQISGLVNNSNQCFSNSVIQFFDAALDGHDVDTVLGPVESVAPFTSPDLSDDDSFDVPKRRGAKKTAKKPESKLSQVRTKIHDTIKKVRKSGKLRDLSPRKHLRALLHRLRQYKTKKQSEKVNGFLFQQILAHGEVSMADEPRDKFDGRHQQDCYEYFDVLLGDIKHNSGDDDSDEEATQRSAIIAGMFHFESETASKCSNESCDYKAAVQKAIGSAHTIHAPEKPAKFEDLFEQSNVSPLDQRCPECGEAMARVTEFTEVADNFVVHVNRVEWPTTTKIPTAIELPLQPIELGGKTFVLNAIIKHKGYSVNAGHYTIYRKRNHDWVTDVHGNSTWYRIDDNEVSTAAAKDIKDSGRQGQCAMLLFKVQQ
jgi:ubiquitin C-terminal hydrolase